MFEIIWTESCPKQNQTFLRKVQFLGHIVSDKGVQPVAKKVQDLKNLKSPENKRDVMQHLRKFRLVQYIHKEFACGFKTLL